MSVSVKGKKKHISVNFFSGYVKVNKAQLEGKLGSKRGRFRKVERGREKRGRGVSKGPLGKC